MTGLPARSANFRYQAASSRNPRRSFGPLIADAHGCHHALSSATDLSRMTERARTRSAQLMIPTRLPSAHGLCAVSSRSRRFLGGGLLVNRDHPRRHHGTRAVVLRTRPGKKLGASGSPSARISNQVRRQASRGLGSGRIRSLSLTMPIGAPLSGVMSKVSSICGNTAPSEATSSTAPAYRGHPSVRCWCRFHIVSSDMRQTSEFRKTTAANDAKN